MAERTILHVDMDAFFASVEQREHPQWRGRPVVVGSDPHARGVVSTCSYEARKFGVHSAMPSRTAYELCPQAIFVRPHMALYEETSARVFQIFERFTPYVEGVSIDEAFLDVTGSLKLFGSAETIGCEIKRLVRSECGVTCSVGIGPNRLLAKIGSELRKPDGLFAFPFDEAEIVRLLAPKPIGILWGVGKRTQEILRRHGIVTCGDLQRTPREQLRSLIGVAAADSIGRHAFGQDETPVAWAEGEDKSVSREHTFGIDEANREVVRQELLNLVKDVGVRFRRHPRWAKTVKVKFRDEKFNTLTRQVRLDLAAADDFTFREAGLQLFDEIWPENERRLVRLIGFGVTDIVFAEELPEAQLFATEQDALLQKLRKRQRVCEALDRLKL